MTKILCYFPAKEDLFKNQFSKMPRLLKFFIAGSQKLEFICHTIALYAPWFYFENLCFILKMSVFFCDSTSICLTSSFRVSHSWVGWMCVWWWGHISPYICALLLFCHVIGCLPYWVSSIYINIRVLSTLILWNILWLMLSGFGLKWKFKYLLIPI